MSRVIKLNKKEVTKGDCVVYVMSRDQRVNDNFALLEAQKSAIESKVPLLVLFNMYDKSGHRSREHFQFMLDGLREIEKSLDKLNIQFVLKIGNVVKNIISLSEKFHSKELYFDFSPLRGPRKLHKQVAKELDIPVFVVDTHNIIPLWVLSDKEEYAAHTIRSKVHKNLEKWLVDIPNIKKHPHKLNTKVKNNWSEAEKIISKIEKSGIKIDFSSGEENAHKALKDFIDNRLRDYAEDRNMPTTDGQSNLSPYLHFGQLSAQRIALEVIDSAEEPPLLFREGKLAKYEGQAKHIDSVNAYLEELIVRRELADNFVFYNENYDNFDGAKDWARDSLNDHRSDPREHLYSKEQLDKAETHDDAWNASQNELRKSGKMHGYMRMYWAKKILEWTNNPEEAIEIAIYLNDHYSIDGGDPNGYTGIMWSIVGIHDRPWFEREVFGKIRYMNRGGLERRFDVEEYQKMWNGK